jgi:hypothetical protein
VALQLPVPKEHPDARDQVIGQWLDAYDYLSRHRWAARIIAEGEHVADSASAFAQSALDALRVLAVGAEESRADLSRVYRVLWHLLLGHVLNVHPVGHTRPEGAGPGGAHETGSTDAAAPVPGPEGASTSRDDLAWALPRVLDGMLGAL